VTELRSLREARGLSQAALAEAAGVSRQLVGAVESGRHAPAVDAALRLARALGVSVEELFGRERTEAALLGPVGDGEPLRIGRVGDRLVAAPLPLTRAGAESWAAADGVAEHGSVRLLAGAAPTGLLVVGCDPALGIAEALLERTGVRRTIAVHGSTGHAIRALAGALAHAAVVHGPEAELPEPPTPVRRIHVARWRVGLGFATRGTPALATALSGRAPLVQREPEAASQQALVRAAGAAGAGSIPAGPIAAGHVAAAALAAAARGVAVTFEPAARRLDLGFLPLETHTVELWLDARWLDHPGAGALVELLASDAFRERVELVGGYDLAGCGATLGTVA
jgi:transcriptional regulator with XRE-family HTH domain